MVGTALVGVKDTGLGAIFAGMAGSPPNADQLTRRQPPNFAATRRTLLTYLSTLHPAAAPVDLANQPVTLLDLSGNNPRLTPEKFTFLPRFAQYIEEELSAAGARFGYGGYGEDRAVYVSPLFAGPGSRSRSVHLGLDVWGPAGTPVYAPLPGRVHSFRDDPAPGSYGPTIVLEHDLPNGGQFYTLYGHLSPVDVTNKTAGAQVQGGERIASFGGAPENGGWPPHLHFQVMVDMLGLRGDFPGVAYREEAAHMLLLCPDPYSFFPSLTAPGH